RVVRVIEVVVPLWVRTERRVVDVRRQGQRRAAAPTADQFCGDQFPFCIGASIGAGESIERADAGLLLAADHIGRLTAGAVRLGNRQGHAGFTGISEYELAGLDRPSLARQGFEAASLDRRLVDTVLVTQ